MEDSAAGKGRGPSPPFASHGEISCLPRTATETPIRLEGDLGSKSLNTKGSQSPLWAPQGEATLPLQEGGRETEPPSTAPPDPASRRALRRARRKMIEEDILQKVTRDTQDPACSDQSWAKGAPCQAAKSGPQPQVPPAGAQQGPLVLSLQVSAPCCPASSDLRLQQGRLPSWPGSQPRVPGPPGQAASLSGGGGGPSKELTLQSEFMRMQKSERSQP